MFWEQLASDTLLRDHGDRILPHILSNNRIIGLLGLAGETHNHSSPSTAWALRSKQGRLLQILAASPKEIALTLHADFHITPAIIEAIRQQFASNWVITPHDFQCDEWEPASQCVRFKSIPLLATWLYSVNHSSLRIPPLPPGLQFREIPYFNAQLGRYIAGFLQDALQQRTDDEELRDIFYRQHFHGIFEADKPLCIASATRKNLGSRCISYVYTPPRLRGRGYAALCVGLLSAKLLDTPGIDSVFLYADQSNPCSNWVYTKLGYRIICSSKTF